MQILHEKIMIKHKIGMDDLTQTLLQWSSEKVDWMAAARSVGRSPVNCTADNPSQAPALRFFRSGHGVSSLPLLKATGLLGCKRFQRDTRRQKESQIFIAYKQKK